jgi:hypothetical protein
MEEGIRLTSQRGKYEAPFAEFSLVNEYVILAQSSDGLRPTIPPDSPPAYVAIYNRCVSAEPEERPTAARVAEIVGVRI